MTGFQGRDHRITSPDRERRANQQREKDNDVDRRAGDVVLVLGVTVCSLIGRVLYWMSADQVEQRGNR